LNGVLPALLFLESSIPTLLPESSLEEKALVLERAFEVDSIQFETNSNHVSFYLIIQSLEFQRVCCEDLISYFFSFDNFNTSFIDKDLREKRENILFCELIRWNDYITQVSKKRIDSICFI